MTIPRSVISPSAFEAFFNASPAPCAIVDGETRFLHCNAVWQSVLGYSIEELLLMQLVDLLHDDDLAIVYQLFQPVVCSSGQPSRYRHRDGSWRWLVCSTSPMPESQAFCVYLTDVSPLMTVQQELRKRDDLMRQMEELARVGAWEGTLETDQITWTDNLFRLYELPAGPAPYHDYTLRSFDFEDGLRLSAAIGECRANGTPWNLILRMTTAQGQRRWVRSVGNLSIRDNKPYSIYGALQDISEQVELEHELRRYTDTLSGMQSITSNQKLGFHEKLEALLALGCEALQLPLGVINRVENNSCEIIATHSSVRKIDSGDRIAFEGTFTEAVIFHNDILACHDVAHSSLALLPSYQLLRFGAYIGIPIVIDASVFGTVMFAAVEQPRAQFSNHELRLVELIAQSASYEIAREQVQVALQRLKDEAEEANRAKSRFLAQMSHELRTPLNSIVGYAHRLLKTQDASTPQRQVDALVAIEGNAAHLVSMINDLLDLSSIEQGGLQLVRVPSDIAQIIHDLVDEVQPQAQQKHLLLQCESVPVKFLLSVDVQRFRQILLHLLANAIKFTERGEVVVSLQIDVEKNRVEVSVRDTGIGISRENRAKLFRKFERLPEHYLGAIRGAGLGLALVWELVALHGGTTHVESEPGVGSCFSIRLPLL